MKYVFLLCVFLTGFGAIAQEHYFYAALDFNKPLTNTSWLGASSNRGFKLGYRSFINERFSAGLDFSNTTYEEYNPTETRQTNSGAFTTDYFKYIYNYSLVASGQYNFRLAKTEAVIPYIGLGLGANHNEYVMYYNIYNDSDQNWGFLARPEAGVLVRFGRRGSIGATAAVHYDYSTNKSEKFNYDRFSSIGAHIGIMLMEW